MKKDRFLVNIRRMLEIINENREKVGYVVVCCICLLFIGIYMEGKFDYRTDEVVCEEFPYDENSVYIVVSPEQKNPLSAINVKFADVENIKGGTIFFDFLCNGEIVEQWNFSSDLFIQDSFKTFKFKKPIEVDDNVYAIKITYQDGESAEYSSDALVDNAITYSLTYRVLKWNKTYWMMALIMFFIVLYLILKNVTEMILMDFTLIGLSIIYLYICPFGMVPDESHHFMRSYEIANVSLVSNRIGEEGIGGNYLPHAVADYGNKEATVDWNQTIALEFPGAALYSPITYFPQVIGIKIAQLFTNKIHYIFLGGKIGNVIINLLLGIVALHVVPFGKRNFFMIMTFPITFQEMVSMAPDDFTITISLFFLAYILRIKYAQEKIYVRDIIVLLVSGIVLALLKIVYVVLLFMIFIVPISKYGSKKKWLSCNVLIIVSATLANILWLRISLGYLSESNPGVNATEQVKYILLHLIRYISILINTFITNIGVWISTMVSSDMGNFVIKTPSIIWISLLGVFMFEMLCADVNKYQIGRYDYVMPFLVFLGGIGLVATSLYVEWTPVENTVIEGIQGRYFTPLLSCFTLSIIQLKSTKYSFICKKNYRLYLYILLANLIVLQDVFSYYIDWIVQ